MINCLDMESLGYPAICIFFCFILGYLAIIFEHVLHVSKTTSALLMAIGCWAFQFADPSLSLSEHRHVLTEHLGTASEVILFLLGALAVVELISAHNGFWLITRWVSARSKISLLWIMSALAFFISAILDNLTTTVVMITLLRKMLAPGEDRLLMGSAVVIAANAGGAWTPIGDVTTTMLWIGGHVTPLGVMSALLIPSLVCFITSLLYFSYQLKGRAHSLPPSSALTPTEPHADLILALGVGCLIFVPIFKMLTGLPPLMGMLLGLGLLWLLTDLIHRHHESRANLRVPAVLTRIDLAGVLFFLGILLTIDALDEAGILEGFANWIDRVMPTKEWTALAIGFSSAVVDNVPLVAAIMKMYGSTAANASSTFWHAIAYTAGTGGSILIIGSAAGVAFMGLEQVSFSWWIRRVTLPATLGYLAGFGVYLWLV